MFRKLLVAAVILATSSSIAFARHPYRGDYKGEVVAPVAACYTYPIPCGPYLGFSVGGRNTYTRAPTVYKGLEGILSLGYGGPLTPMFYLGAEVFVGDSINLQNYTNVSGGSTRTTWNYGIDLIPGVKITNYVMGYLRLGAVRTRFNQQGENVWGWRAGIGAQTNLWDCWDLRGEYIYSLSRRVDGIGRPQSDQWNLGLVWRFM